MLETAVRAASMGEREAATAFEIVDDIGLPRLFDYFCINRKNPSNNYWTANLCMET